MRHRTHRSVVLAVALAFAGAGAAAQTAAEAPDYFPLRLHDWWRYRSTQASGDTSEFTLTVVADAKQPDGSVRKCIELATTKPLTQDWYSKSPSGVLLHEEEYLGGGGKVTLDPARPLLRLPPTKGTTRSWNGVARANVRVSETNEVFAPEAVKTPAGGFDAIKVVTQIEQGGARATKTSWFAPGVGIVRQATESDGLSSTTELLDYSFKRKR